MWEGHLENTYISNSFTCRLPTKTTSGLEHWNHLCNLLCVGRLRNGAADRPVLTNVIKIFPLIFPILIYFCFNHWNMNHSPYVCVQADRTKTKIHTELKELDTVLSSFRFYIFTYIYIVGYWNIQNLLKIIWFSWLLTRIIEFASTCRKWNQLKGTESSFLFIAGR